ncbi:retinol dehydrogenase 12-like [Amphiura filiformis]|uniref:retinol dehydrogenase 12-like n=1 Tax=Amphiura filiformis TaxID=82378 RepID=UPI003B221343
MQLSIAKTIIYILFSVLDIISLPLSGFKMALLLVFGIGILVFIIYLYSVNYYLNGGFYRRNCKHIKVKLHGKTAIITGGNAGIGKMTAIDLARRGARVVIACRNPKKAEDAVKEIQGRSGSSNVVYRHLDLSDQGSVRRFAEEFLKEESRLDYLINNAGIFAAPKDQYTSEGYNMVFATNHFGHFLLTLLLLDILKKSSPSRIINVTSIAYAQAGNMHFEKRDSQGRVYPGLCEYDRSKVANILFTKELARRLEGTGVSAFALHPGFIKTDIFNKSTEFVGISRFALYLVLILYRSVLAIIGIDEEAGAQTTLYCALEESLPKLSGGLFDNCRLTKEITKVVRDAGMAKKLWEVSCQATGIED